MSPGRTFISPRTPWPFDCLYDMDTKELTEHWDRVYTTKESQDMSWYQPTPQISLDLIAGLNLSKDAAIIDVGGGEGRLAEYLLSAGYTDITVLDISQASLDKAQARLGENASKIRWLHGEVSKFRHDRTYDLWHDRATFHFFQHEHEVNDYCYVTEDSLKPGGFAIIGVFGPNAPKTCSGLQVRRYSPEELTLRFVDRFAKTKCLEVEHHTPSGTLQPFTFCIFKRK